jgi:hypothetical protein
MAVFIAILWSTLTPNFSILKTNVVGEIFKTIKFKHEIFIIEHKFPDYLKFS